MQRALQWCCTCRDSGEDCRSYSATTVMQGRVYASRRFQHQHGAAPFASYWVAHFLCTVCAASKYSRNPRSVQDNVWSLCAAPDIVCVQAFSFKFAIIQDEELTNIRSCVLSSLLTLVLGPVQSDICVMRLQCSVPSSVLCPRIGKTHAACGVAQLRSR